jgi:hypothetical protein
VGEALEKAAATGALGGGGEGASEEEGRGEKKERGDRESWGGKRSEREGE